MSSNDSIHLRLRRESDLDELVALTIDTHHDSGYPRYLPADPRGFLVPAGEVAAWVAEIGGRVVGHVALHRADGHPTLPAAHRATGLSPQRLAVLARLLVASSARRLGVGRALVDHALRHAEDCGQRVVLDVVKDSQHAIAFYQAHNWIRLEPLQLPIGAGRQLDLWVYLSPAPSDQPAPTSGRRSAGNC